MGNKDGNKDLVDFATKEAQLIWNRYGCMVVANSILLGFIGQLATGKNHDPYLGIFTCSIGLVIALLWLFITSYGWSLSWYTLKQSDADAKQAYENWRNSVWKNGPDEPFWLFAHIVIVVFCVAYVLLTFYFTKEMELLARWSVRWGLSFFFLLFFVRWRCLVRKELCLFPKRKKGFKTIRLCLAIIATITSGVYIGSMVYRYYEGGWWLSAGIAGAATGFLVVCFTYYLLRWLILGFADDEQKQ